MPRKSIVPGRIPIGLARSRSTVVERRSAPIRTRWTDFIVRIQRVQVHTLLEAVQDQPPLPIGRSSVFGGNLGRQDPGRNSPPESTVIRPHDAGEEERVGSGDAEVKTDSEMLRWKNEEHRTEEEEKTTK